MNVIDKILNEWSFRCHDGVVDINNPEKVKILFEILKPFLKEDIDDDILNVLTNIDDSKTKEKVLKYLQNINKKEDKVEDEVESNLEKELKSKNFSKEITEYISLLASKYNITEELEEYLKSNELLSLKDLGKSGNLYNVIKLKTDFPDNFIRRIITYTPPEEGKLLGVGEIALALFFNAVKQKVGDIRIDNQTVELKGSGARFPGKGGIGRSGDISSIYQDFAKKYPSIELKSKNSSLTFYINQILIQNPNDLDFINNELDNIYPETKDINLKKEDISDINNIMNILYKKYIASYVRSYKDNDYYMLISKSSSDYELYNPNELIKSAGDGNISFLGNITKSSSYPQLDI